MERKQQKSNREKPNRYKQDGLFQNSACMPDWSFEEDLFRKGFSTICGIDEAGRGPLAGPVMAACVIFHKRQALAKITDSKALSSRSREELFEQIITISHISYSIGVSSADEIDRLNILNATFLAMKRALKNLSVRPDALLIDGNMGLKDIGIYQKTVVKGDARSFSIAAASIIAKVTRDRWIIEKSQEYPEYEFEQHKGYGTRRHMELLKKIGPCSLHRKSFAPVRDML